MKTCIITGAGSGIGQAVAVEIGHLGEFDYLALIGRSKKNCKKHVPD